jgi:hypothetical protein
MKSWESEIKKLRSWSQRFCVLTPQPWWIIQLCVHKNGWKSVVNVEKGV